MSFLTSIVDRILPPTRPDPEPIALDPIVFCRACGDLIREITWWAGFDQVDGSPTVWTLDACPALEPAYRYDSVGDMAEQHTSRGWFPVKRYLRSDEGIDVVPYDHREAAKARIPTVVTCPDGCCRSDE